MVDIFRDCIVNETLSFASETKKKEYCFHVAVLRTGNGTRFGANSEPQKHINSCSDDLCYTMYGIIVPTTGTVSVMCNLLTLLVLVSQMSKCGIGSLLVGLTFFDLLTIISGMSAYMPFAHCQVRSALCDFFTRIIPTVQALGMISHCISIWICVLISVERYIAVCRPIHARAHCTKANSIRAMVIVGLVSMLYCLPKFFELYYDKECGCVKQSWLRKDQAYRISYQIMLRWLLEFLSPLTTIILLNFIMIRTLLCKSNIQCHNRQLNFEITYIAAGAVCLFASTNILALANDIFEVTCDPKTLRKLGHRALVYLGNLMVICGSSLNIVLYCLVGKKFRRNLWRFLTYPSKRSRRKAFRSRSPHSSYNDFSTMDSTQITISRKGSRKERPKAVRKRKWALRRTRSLGGRRSMEPTSSEWSSSRLGQKSSLVSQYAVEKNVCSMSVLDANSNSQL